MSSSKDYVNSIGSTLTEHRKYLKALHILYQEVNGKATIQTKYSSVVKDKLTNMHHSSKQAKALTEALDLTVDNGLSFEELGYNNEFLEYAKTVTERITNKNYFKYYMQTQFQRLGTNTKELISD